MRHLLRSGHVALLLLPCGPYPVSGRRDHGGPGDFAAAALREVTAMKVVVVEKRTGFWGFFLRKLYGVKKVTE